MGRLSGKFNNVSAKYSSADTLNFEGFPAWEIKGWDLYEKMMLTGGFFTTFYMNESYLIHLARKIIRKAMLNDPQKAIKIASKARTEGFMRHMPILSLSQYPTKNGAPSEFSEIIRTPRDLSDYIDLTKAYRGLGRSIKRAINEWISRHISEFTAIKYRKYLSDAIKLAHYKPETDNQNALADYIVKNKRYRERLSELPQIRAFELLKKREMDPVEAITKYNLEMQTVLGAIKPTKEIWKALIPTMSIMQLIKNLAALEHNGVLNDKNALETIMSRVTIENLKKGMVFPFRIVQAAMMIKNEFLKDHLFRILERYSREYDFSVLGRVCIAPDVSASMTWRIGRVTPAEISAWFTAVLGTGIKDAVIYPWDTNIYELEQGKTPEYYVNRVLNGFGGGTNMDLPVKKLIQDKTEIDSLIMLTDSEEWAGHGWLDPWIRYKENINPSAIAYLIRVDPYPTQPFSPIKAEEYGIIQIYGWNDAVFKILTWNHK